MDVFQAVADPLRRHLIEALARGDRTAGELADQAQAAFGVSQPAVSRHLRVLREAGVTESRIDGSRRIYRLCPHRVAEIAAWAERQTRFWTDRLDALETELARED